MAEKPPTMRSRWTRPAALLLVLALVAAACGGAGDDNGGTKSTTADDGTPKPGGKVVYALEAETTGGLCLQEAQLAISGIQVARSIYDYVTMPNEKGEYVPFLAESLTPNATYDAWTIKLRPGIKFHDGSPLTAQVLKNNLDAYRGQYPNRGPLLFIFVFENIKDTKVVDPLTLRVTTKTPWPAFPAYMYMNGRVGITAQAQLDDKNNCAFNLIGTGPFKLKEWKVNDHVLLEKNPNYWREGLPYLDELEYRPIAEAVQRVNALQGGEVNVMHTSGALQIVDLRNLADAEEINLLESAKFAEVGYVMLNASIPPFDNINARKAVAYATDRETTNEIRNKGILKSASGPFAEGNMGYLEDTGFPEFDLDKAKEFVAKYKAETGEDLKFTYSTTPDPNSIDGATLMKEQMSAAGIKMDFKTVEQSQLINDAIGHNFQAVGWRLHAGGDPDTQYIWWHGGSPVNFGNFADTEIDRLLEEGRVESDPAKREIIYQDLNRRFADQLYDVWDQWTLWAIGTAKDVHGIMGPDLPDGSKPFPGLSDGHNVSGIWIG